MKENELRIGNLVYWFGSFVQVSISDFICQEFKDNGGIFEDLKPIPLTEEWLVKFGFKFSNDFQWWYKGEHNLTLDLGGQDTYECMCYPIKYVHQLQNLYFALTGDEL